MKKQIKDLRSWDVKRIEAMYEEHGMDRQGVDIVARSFNITESAAEAMATAIKDRNVLEVPQPIRHRDGRARPCTTDRRRPQTAPRRAPLLRRCRPRRPRSRPTAAACGPSPLSSSRRSLRVISSEPMFWVVSFAGPPPPRRLGPHQPPGAALPARSVHRRLPLLVPGLWATPFVRGLGRQGRPTEG